jgi:N-methylhydantoinase B/oxoprolinase/acetone carboxylase alpha subunit
LPDITIITPVFDKGTNEIIFFTASRGHHADIGGILPGSMPPTSVNIFEEGAEIVSLKIVDGGMFDKKGLYEYMVEKPAQYPGSSGCRNIKDVESDLKAVGHSKMLLSDFITHSCFEANCGQPQGSSANQSKSVTLTIYLAHALTVIFGCSR